MEGMSNILAAAHAGMVDLDLSMAGLMDMGEGLKGLGMGKLKGGRGVMKSMAGGAKARQIYTVYL